jgi:hypothetical protein
LLTNIWYISGGEAEVYKFTYPFFSFHHPLLPLFLEEREREGRRSVSKKILNNFVLKEKAIHLHSRILESN